MAEVATTATTRKAATRKAVARKAPARKAAAGKTAARPAAKRTATRATARKPAVSIDKVSGTVKEVAYVQLGLCGKAYDEVNARMSKVRKDAPKQWTQLVKRGEQVQRDRREPESNDAPDCALWKTKRFTCVHLVS